MAKVREPFNAISHLAGAVIVGVSAVALIVPRLSPPTTFAAFLVFGLSNVLLYAASAAYHWTHETRPWLQKLDHAAIYVMIAGTYTPIALLVITGAVGWLILGLQWGLAAVGLLASILLAKTPTWLRLSLYLGMGWMAAVVAPQMTSRAGATFMTWMLAGGLCYTVGAIVYASKRPNPWPGKFGFHELWHVFVLSGTLCHLVMMSYL